MERPFFTIVIPTKNRPSLLKDAIRSVLLQNFSDFEVLVSDNFNEKDTQDVIASFAHHPKFKSVRTPHELNMIDHWEWATKQAQGKYVMVLADRKVLYQNALKKAQKIILKHPEINAFSVGVQTFDEEKGHFNSSSNIGNTKRFNSTELITNFLNENYYTSQSLDTRFPKTLNGFYKNAFAHSVREKVGHYFNLPGVTTPDYSSFFINVAFNKSIVYIGEEIILTQGESTSNGRAFGAGKYHNYFSSLGLEDPLKNQLVPAPFIYSLLMNDFQIVQQRCKTNLESIQPNEINYLRCTGFEICLKKFHQLNEKDLAFFEDAWTKGINQLSNKVDKAHFIQQIELEFNQRDTPQKWDKLIRFNYHLKDYLKLRFPSNHWMNNLFHYYYESALKAANFKNV